MAEPFYFSTARLVRLAYLCACGCTMREITEDLEFTDERAIRDVMRQHGLKVRSEAAGRRTISVNVSAKTFAALTAAAAQRDIIGAEKASVMAERTLDRMGDDPSLINAVNNDLPKVA